MLIRHIIAMGGWPGAVARGAAPVMGKAIEWGKDKV
jgi:hypothetical protein